MIYVITQIIETSYLHESVSLPPMYVHTYLGLHVCVHETVAHSYTGIHVGGAVATTLRDLYRPGGENLSQKGVQDG